MNPSTEPLAMRTQMLIRRPAHEAFEAFVDPHITTRFWFMQSSGRLEPGAIGPVDLGDVSRPPSMSDGWRARSREAWQRPASVAHQGPRSDP